MRTVYLAKRIALCILWLGLADRCNCAVDICSDCIDLQGRAFVSPLAAMTHVLSAPLPATKELAGLVSLHPYVFDVEIDSHGRVCRARAMPSTTTLSNNFARSIAAWTFRPLRYKNRAICMRTYIYVYVRRDRGALTTLIIPGLKEK